MKKILLGLFIVLLTSSNAFATLNVSMECNIDDYKVFISGNVNENVNEPISAVIVYKNREEVYSQFYSFSYESHVEFEAWGYAGYKHTDGGIGVAATSESTAVADIFIDLGNNEYVYGISSNCKIQRY